jgi:nicotinamide-nucleotide amidase
MHIKTAEILCVGTELLIGDIVNTNAAFLSKHLAALGISQYHQSVVGDNPRRLKEALALSLSRSDLVLMSGGLGPTYDDLTKEVACECMGAELVHDEASYARICDYFARRGRQMSENNKKQALQPKGGVIFQNDHGTAPGSGIWNADHSKLVILLPGPPRELQPMFLDFVLPFLQTMTEQCFVSRNVHIVGMGESAVEAVLKDRMIAAINPTIAPYCQAGEVRLRVTASAKTAQEGKAMCDALIKTLYETEVGPYIYGVDIDLTQAVVNELRARHQKIAVAESCTGGGIGARITNVSGASEVFDGGVISYSNEIKARVLGVSQENLDTYGAVSAQVAKEMAQGVMRLMNADYGLSVTGIAGPTGGTPEKPVGLVYIGLATRNGVFAQECHFAGDRDWNRTLSATEALRMALLAIRKTPIV